MGGITLSLVFQQAATRLRRTKLPLVEAKNSTIIGSKQSRIDGLDISVTKKPEFASGRKIVSQTKKGLWHRERFYQLSALSFVLLLCSLIYIFRNAIEGLEGYGYLGAFLIPMFCCATIIVPVPGLIIVFTLGAVLDPFLVGLISAAGGTIGEITGYLLGYSGRAVIENISLYQRVEHSMKRWGAMPLFVLALIPNPLFDIAGAVAGALRFPLWKFFVYSGAGRIIKHTFVAFAGAWGMEFILHFL